MISICLVSEEGPQGGNPVRGSLSPVPPGHRRLWWRGHRVGRGFWADAVPLRQPFFSWAATHRRWFQTSNVNNSYFSSSATRTFFVFLCLSRTRWKCYEHRVPKEQQVAAFLHGNGPGDVRGHGLVWCGVPDKQGFLYSLWQSPVNVFSLPRARGSVERALWRKTRGQSQNCKMKKIMTIVSLFFDSNEP